MCCLNVCNNAAKVNCFCLFKYLVWIFFSLKVNYENSPMKSVSLRKLMIVISFLKRLSTGSFLFFFLNLKQVCRRVIIYQRGSRSRPTVRSPIKTPACRSPTLDWTVKQQSRYLSILVSSSLVSALSLLLACMSYCYVCDVRLPNYRRPSEFDSFESAIRGERHNAIGRKAAGRLLQRQGSSPLWPWGLQVARLWSNLWRLSSIP